MKDGPAAAGAGGGASNAEQRLLPAPIGTAAWVQKYKRAFPWEKAALPPGRQYLTRLEQYQIAYMLWAHLTNLKSAIKKQPHVLKKKENLTTPKLKALMAEQLGMHTLRSSGVVAQWMTLFRTHVIGVNAEKSKCRRLLQFGATKRNLNRSNRQRPTVLGEARVSSLRAFSKAT